MKKNFYKKELFKEGKSISIKDEFENYLFKKI